MLGKKEVQTVSAVIDTKFARFFAHFLLNDFKGLLKKYGYDISNCDVPPVVSGGLCQLIYNGDITRASARQLLEGVFRARKEV